MVFLLANKINNWIAEHIVAIYSLLGIFMLLWICVTCLFNQAHFDDTGSIIVLVFVIVCYVICGIMVFRLKTLKTYSSGIYRAIDSLYFHGIKLRYYLENSAIVRLENWAKLDASYELAALAMMVLKNNKTAVLHQGELQDVRGIATAQHAWVEFKIPLHGWYVADLAWLGHGFVPKKQYLKIIEGKLTPMWSCSYQDFWDIELANHIYGSVKQASTSHVLWELSAFSVPDFVTYGFKNLCYTHTKLKLFRGNRMVPFYAHAADRPISIRIIQDFVKNPRRKHPKARSIRLARREIRSYERWKADQLRLVSST